MDEIDNSVSPELEIGVERRPFRERLLKIARNAGLLGVAAAVYAFEQSPLNESIRADVGAEVLTDTDSALLVGMAVAGITMAVETVSGLATAATLSVKSGLLGRFNGWLARRGSNKLKAGNKKGEPVGDIMLGLGGGSSLVVVKRQYEHGGRTFGENAKTAFKASLGIAAFSGVLGGATGEIIQFAAERGHAEGAQEALDIISSSRNWLLGYIGFFGIKHSIKGAAKGIQNLRMNSTE